MKVLLVEDSPTDAALIREMLTGARNTGFELEHANCLAAGLERLGAAEFDVVLLDLMLPDSQGLETFTMLHAHAPNVPILVMSGLDDEEVAVEAVRVGAQDYLVKGQADSSLLVRAIRYAVERKKAQQRIEAYQMQLRSLASELTVTEERERRRIAIELHDRIGQTLAFVTMRLGILQTSLADPVKDELAGIREQIGEIIREVRSLTCDISPPVLYELGLEAALEWLAERIEEQYGIKVELHDDGQSKPLGKDTRALLFRAVQELLVNVVKHADAEAARVSVWRESDSIRIRVEDDGKGFFSDEVLSCAGERDLFGLFSIQERVAELGGKFEIKSNPGEGTQATLVIPAIRTWRAKRRE